MLSIYSNKNFPKAYKLCQVSWKLCPKPNKPKIYCQRFLNICQSGGISPNLVTLAIVYATYHLTLTQSFLQYLKATLCYFPRSVRICLSLKWTKQGSLLTHFWLLLLGTCDNKISVGLGLYVKTIPQIQFAHIRLTVPTSGLYVGQIVLKNVIYL